MTRPTLREALRTQRRLLIGTVIALYAIAFLYQLWRVFA